MGLESTYYEVFENEPEFMICAIVNDSNCPNDFSFQLTLTTSTPGRIIILHKCYIIVSIKHDVPICVCIVYFRDQSNTSEILRFEICERKVCTLLSIVDDDIAEEGESFNITLERTPDLQGIIELYPVNGVVSIIDDDGNDFIAV